MPRFVCAPDSFKGCLTAPEVAAAMARGIRRVAADAVIDECPIADGGEGTVQALVQATGGSRQETPATDPLGREIVAHWGWVGDAANRTAVVEMAAASGLTLLEPSERDPLVTSSYGTGQVIAAAARAGAKRILLGLGGSATNDGGCGAAMALGVRFFDAEGVELTRPITGADLYRIARIETPGRSHRDVEVTVCRDVDNPLTGPGGAAAVYGPQKGATPAAVQKLDRGLCHLGSLFRDQLGVDVDGMPGAGAAGGMGGGIVAMLGADSRPGIELILDAVGFRDRVRGAALCLTGEGRLDGQSLAGKACLGVARVAHAAAVPTLAIVGQLALTSRAPLAAVGLDAVELAPGLAPEESMRRAAELLEIRTAELVQANGSRA